MPSFRMGKVCEPASEFWAKDEAIDYNKKESHFDSAAKEAEKPEPVNGKLNE